ncbi:hypothetical protein CHCC14429_1303 [Bacillus licheniformis]|nr:hypothetical protein CHCC14429_1303 [Bacillus licheniformis]TWN96985.1 hypothetical protein CHCC20489_3045 [Bacillus licheniformis]
MMTLPLPPHDQRGVHRFRKKKFNKKLNFLRLLFCFSAEPFFFQFIKFSAFLHFFKRFVELLGQIASLFKGDRGAGFFIRFFRQIVANQFFIFINIFFGNDIFNDCSVKGGPL